MKREPPALLGVVSMRSRLPDEALLEALLVAEAVRVEAMRLFFGSSARVGMHGACQRLVDPWVASLSSTLLGADRHCLAYRDRPS